ncbi:MAG TPA: hypothetical protein VKP64_09100 [Mycobacteriales bacterium]|nr:hypothetical protein [Mycobacteriales bacterium]
MTRRAYEVRLRGTLGPAARQAFVDLDIDVEPPTTVLSDELDQADLHALLDLVRALRLELVEITQTGEPEGT